MTAIPSALWRTLGIGIVALIIGRIGLGVVRYQNGGRDFGAQLSSEVMKQPDAAPLTKATLQLGEPTYDETTLTNRPDNYVGRVRYRDGDAGSIMLEVTKRDWLYQPTDFNFSFQPTDFGSRIASHIRTEVNDKLRESVYSVTDMSLSRQTRTKYSGRFFINRDIKHPHTIEVLVETFHADGSPATWRYWLD